MRKLYQYLPLGLLFVLLVSCKKDSPPALTADVFSGKKWLLISSVISAPNAPEVDAYATLKDCVKDNTIEFNQNYDYIYDEGGTKCQPSDPQTQYGSWVMSSDAKQLTITFNGNKRAYSVDELSNQNLKLKFAFANTNGTTITQVNTYKVTP